MQKVIILQAIAAICVRPVGIVLIPQTTELLVQLDTTKIKQGKRSVSLARLVTSAQVHHPPLLPALVANLVLVIK